MALLVNQILAIGTLNKQHKTVCSGTSASFNVLPQEQVYQINGEKELLI
jgi:hypothetical protein